MRTRNIDGLRLALLRISANQSGVNRPGNEISRTLAAPGHSLSQSYGLPAPIIAVLDGLFDGLPWAEGREVALALPGAVARPGRDLRRVLWKFLAYEVEALLPSARALPTGEFYRRVGRELTGGLEAVAERRPWLGAIEIVEQIQRSIPFPSQGQDSPVLTARLEHQIAHTLLSTARAMIVADSAVVAAVRLRTCEVAWRADIARVAQDAEGRVGDMARAALRSSSEATAIGAALRVEAIGERLATMNADRLASVRRQAVALLEMVRKG